MVPSSNTVSAKPSKGTEWGLCGRARNRGASTEGCGDRMILRSLGADQGGHDGCAHLCDLGKVKAEEVTTRRRPGPGCEAANNHTSPVTRRASTDRIMGSLLLTCGGRSPSLLATASAIGLTDDRRRWLRPSEWRVSELDRLRVCWTSGPAEARSDGLGRCSKQYLTIARRWTEQDHLRRN